MADFIFKPTANSAGEFAQALEFNGLAPSQSVAVADGTYDIYQKVIAGFVVLKTFDGSARFSVESIGSEATFDFTGMPDDTLFQLTIENRPHAGTYSTRSTDNAPLTLGMIRANPTPYVHIDVAGPAEVGATQTVTRAAWIFDGDAPQDAVIQHRFDGVNVGNSAPAFVLPLLSSGVVYDVAETFGDVTILSAPKTISALPFTPQIGLRDTLYAWFDLTDAAGLFQDKDRTRVIETNGQNIRGFFDKSENAHHAFCAENGITWDATNGQVLLGGGQTIAMPVAAGLTTTMEVFISIKTAAQFAMFAEGFGSKILGGVASGQGVAASQNVGSPTYSKDNTDLGVSVTRADLFTAYVTDVGMVIHARDVNMSKISDFVYFLAYGRAGGFGLNGSVKDIVVTRALTPQERAENVQWMQTRMPV